MISKVYFAMPIIVVSCLVVSTSIGVADDADKKFFVPDSAIPYGDLPQGLRCNIRYLDSSDQAFYEKEINKYGVKEEREALMKEELDRFRKLSTSLPLDEFNALKMIVTERPNIHMYFSIQVFEGSKMHVSSLDISGARVEPRGNLRQIMGQVKNINQCLVKLPYLRGVYFTDYGKGDLDFEILGNLSRLVMLEPPLDVTDADLLKMKCLPKIEWLELEGCESVNGSFLKSLNGQSHLKYLGLGFGGFSKENMQLLFTVSNLKCIEPPATSGRWTLPKLQQLIDKEGLDKAWSIWGERNKSEVKKSSP